MTGPMDAVAAATANVPRMYPLNGVPSSPDYPYGSYSAVLGRGDVLSLDGSEGLRWGQVVVQTFGRTTDSALDHAEKARTALVDTRLEIAGYDTTPCTEPFDPAVIRDPDDSGVVAVTRTFTFTATPA